MSNIENHRITINGQDLVGEVKGDFDHDLEGFSAIRRARAFGGALPDYLSHISSRKRKPQEKRTPKGIRRKFIDALRAIGPVGKMGRNERLSEIKHLQRHNLEGFPNPTPIPLQIEREADQSGRKMLKKLK